MENKMNPFDLACKAALGNSEVNQRINGQNFYKSIKRLEDFSIQEDYIKYYLTKTSLTPTTQNITNKQKTYFFKSIITADFPTLPLPCI